jgi:hypothetical protein
LACVLLARRRSRSLIRPVASAAEVKSDENSSRRSRSMTIPSLKRMSFSPPAALTTR